MVRKRRLSNSRQGRSALALALVMTLLLVGCGGAPPATTRAPATQAPAITIAPMTTDPATDRCTLAMTTYADLASCQGESEEYSIEVATSSVGKTLGRIIVPSKEPIEILAAMGAYARENSGASDSFTVFAFGSETDAQEGGYNRGRIFWNNGGPIEVDVCTTFFDIGEGVEVCDEHVTMTLDNG